MIFSSFHNHKMKPLIPMVSAFAFIALLGVNGSGSEAAAVLPTARKLFTTSNTSDYGNGGAGSPNRIGIGGEGCSKDSILIEQGQTAPLPSGIPTYTVDIENVCLPETSESCSISDIHLSCGWFSSARTLDPSVFRRLDYNDCLVNDGKPLHPGEAISFQYADTFAYPLAVTSVSCT